MAEIIQFPGLGSEPVENVEDPHEEMDFSLEIPSIDHLMGYYDNVKGQLGDVSTNERWMQLEKSILGLEEEIYISSSSASKPSSAQFQAYKEALRKRIQEAAEEYKKQHPTEIIPFPFERIRKSFLQLAARLSKKGLRSFHKEARQLRNLTHIGAWEPEDPGDYSGEFGFGGESWKGGEPFSQGEEWKGEGWREEGVKKGYDKAPETIEEAKAQLIEYLWDEYLAKIIEVNDKIISTEPESDPIFDFSDAQIDDDSFLNSFMLDISWVNTNDFHDKWKLIDQAYDELQGTSEWEKGVNNFNDIMRVMMEEANIPMEKAPSVEDLGQMFKFEALRLAVRLSRRGFRKEARQLRSLFAGTIGENPDWKAIQKMVETAPQTEQYYKQMEEEEGKWDEEGQKRYEDYFDSPEKEEVWIQQATQEYQTGQAQQQTSEYLKDFADNFPDAPFWLVKQIERMQAAAKNPQEGEAAPSYGKKEHIKKSTEILANMIEIDKGLVRDLPPGLDDEVKYVKGYVAIPFTDHGVRSVALYNATPMAGKVDPTKKEKVRTTGQGAAFYVLPYEIDGQLWHEYLKTRDKNDLREDVKRHYKENEPGWFWSQRGDLQVSLLQGILDQYLRAQGQPSMEERRVGRTNRVHILKSRTNTL